MPDDCLQALARKDEIVALGEGLGMRVGAKAHHQEPTTARNAACSQQRATGSWKNGFGKRTEACYIHVDIMLFTTEQTAEDSRQQPHKLHRRTEARVLILVACMAAPSVNVLTD
jgi:hypothetical protein